LVVVELEGKVSSQDEYLVKDETLLVTLSRGENTDGTLPIEESELLSFEPASRIRRV
jgi:hypothetical protein